ncbi:LytTR family DNA-binding domain-containing protein [Clostridiaceae bacterium M8S5]|nr:LytTR family DNA-binding domain-containing protein [Clostridiaceae bacterium M8S5]
MSIRIAICEDEKAEREYLKLLINRWDTDKKATIKSFESAESFLFHYAEDKSFDILLLDIDLKEMDGIELAKHIRSENESIQIVFTTGLPDFIAQGYDVSALHYLMKPIRECSLFCVLDKAVKNISKSNKSIIVNVDGETIRLMVNSIMCIEAMSHSVIITTTNENYTVKKSMKEMIILLNDDFIKCHRSYFVGLKHIKKITKTDIILDNDTKVPLSRRQYGTVNQTFINYYKGEQNGPY